jgi:serine/threonine-protein kinase RIO1
MEKLRLAESAGVRLPSAITPLTVTGVASVVGVSAVLAVPQLVSSKADATNALKNIQWVFFILYLVSYLRSY